MRTEQTGNLQAKYYQTYNENVLPILYRYEDVRLKILKDFRTKNLIFWLIFIAVVVVAMFFFFGNSLVDNIFGPSADIYKFIVPVIISGIAEFLIILYIIFYPIERKKHNNKFSQMLKENIFQELLTAFGDIKWIGHDSLKDNTQSELMDDTTLDASGLFIDYNTRYIDDEFEGTYKDVPFKICETRMFDIHGSGKSRTCICAFSGVIISFKFNKIIKNRTTVSTKGDLTKKHNALCTALLTSVVFINLFEDGYAHWKVILIACVFVGVFWIVKMTEKKEEPLNKVNLEDPVFSKRFEVFSSDQVEARYLVSPAFMERFYNLQTVFGSKKIKCSFYDDTLMIAINTNKNLFEIGNLFKTLQDPTSIQEFYKELCAIYNMIEYFKLDDKNYLTE